MSQQAAEKALKGLIYFREGRGAITHQFSGTSGLIQVTVKTDPSFEKYYVDAGMLDQYYIPTRYPDAIPSGAPYEMYQKSQTDEALQKAEQIVEHVKSVIEGTG